VNRAGGRSGSLRNIGRIEQWNVGSGHDRKTRTQGRMAAAGSISRPRPGHSATSQTRRKQSSAVPGQTTMEPWSRSL
jgi:hypothetical protein